MKKMLITGFEPFGGESINPSWEAVSRLPDEIGNWSLTKVRIPVEFGVAADTVMQVAEKIVPDAIVCVGQAGGRDAVTPELVGINLRHSSVPDNGGYQPTDEPVVAGGADAYFSTLPVRKMAEATVAVGVPSSVSYSAGSYVCNDLLYTLLHRYRESGTRVGFVHIPYATEQGKTPAMDLSTLVKGLSAAIAAID